MKTLLLALSITAMLLVGCSSGESYLRKDFDFSSVEKVAIIEVSGQIFGEPAKNQISDFFTMELLKKGYVPIERAQVKTLLKEQKFQAGNITTDADAAKAGKILNVPVVMLVNIPTHAEKINMTAKMINVEDGSTLWVGSGFGRTGESLLTIFGAAAGAAAGASVGGDDSSSKTTGAVIGGVLGGVTGHALTPQQAQQTQKIIKKICVSLPHR